MHTMSVRIHQLPNMIKNSTSIYFKKWCISGSTQFKPMLFKCQLHFYILIKTKRGEKCCDPKRGVMGWLFPLSKVKLYSQDQTFQ